MFERVSAVELVAHSIAYIITRYKKLLHGATLNKFDIKLQTIKWRNKIIILIVYV